MAAFNGNWASIIKIYIFQGMRMNYERERRPTAFILASGCLLLGIAAVYFLIYETTVGYSSLKWPKTKGVIVNTWITKSYDPGSIGGQFLYAPNIAYEYTVNNKPYEGETIGYPGWRSLLSYAKNKIASYPTTGVDVFYDPKSPAHSCLEPGVSISFILLMSTLSFVFLCLGAIGFGFNFKKRLNKKMIRQSSKIMMFVLIGMLFLSISFVYAETAEEYFNHGVVSYGQGKLSQAISDYTKAIELNPNYVGAYCNRGSSYDDQGNYTQAISDFNKAIEINPKFALFYLNRGLAYGKQSNFTQAISDFTQAIEINPNLVVAYGDRGAAYLNQGNLSQAASDFNKAIELDPNYAAAYSNRGAIYAEQGNLSQAISDLGKSIEINQNYLDAYVNRGLVYNKQGNFTQAFSDFTKAIKINPNYAEAYEGRAYAYFGTKEYGEAWIDVHKAEMLRYKPDKEDLEFLDKLKKASGRDK